MVSEIERAERIVSNAQELYELLKIAQFWCEHTEAPVTLLDAISKVLARIDTE